MTSSYERFEGVSPILDQKNVSNILVEKSVKTSPWMLVLGAMMPVRRQVDANLRMTITISQWETNYNP